MIHAAALLGRGPAGALAMVTVASVVVAMATRDRRLASTALSCALLSVIVGWGAEGHLPTSGLIAGALLGAAGPVRSIVGQPGGFRWLDLASGWRHVAGAVHDGPRSRSSLGGVHVGRLGWHPCLGLSHRVEQGDPDVLAIGLVAYVAAVDGTTRASVLGGIACLGLLAVPGGRALGSPRLVAVVHAVLVLVAARVAGLQRDPGGARDPRHLVDHGCSPRRPIALAPGRPVVGTQDPLDDRLLIKAALGLLPRGDSV